MSIQAIQTHYDGYHFRSRLEARWAVFFTLAGIPYQYEIEGFKTAKGKGYLPDFYLPDCGLWVEVKGNLDSIDSDWLTERASALPPPPENTRGESFGGLMLVGDVPSPKTPAWVVKEFGENPWPDLEYDFAWPVVIDESTLISAGFGRYYKNRRPWMHSHGTLETFPYGSFDVVEDYMHPDVHYAYQEARRARFEHGEKPAA